MRVYRVENIDGEGPYWQRPGYNEIHAEPNYVKHPAPSEEDIKTGYHVFGFASKKQFAAWFSGEKEALQQLAELGFHLSHYEVPKPLIQIGRKQVAFERQSYNPGKPGPKRNPVYAEPLL